MSCDLAKARPWQMSAPRMEANERFSKELRAGLALLFEQRGKSNLAVK